MPTESKLIPDTCPLCGGTKTGAMYGGAEWCGNEEVCGLSTTSWPRIRELARKAALFDEFKKQRQQEAHALKALETIRDKTRREAVTESRVSAMEAQESDAEKWKALRQWYESHPWLYGLFSICERAAEMQLQKLAAERSQSHQQEASAGGE